MDAGNPAPCLDGYPACRAVLYLQQHAFGGKVDGQTWGTATTAPPVNLLRIEENLSAAHLRLSGAFIENMDWYKLMERYDRLHTLFYLDPPYWETEGYGVDFPLSEYERMADLMSRIKGKAILSLNDHPDIRRVFSRFQMDVTRINYTVGGGGRAVEREELIIYSWDKEQSPLACFREPCGRLQNYGSSTLSSLTTTTDALRSVLF